MREAVALNNLGALRRFQHRMEEAVRLFQDAIGIIETECGPDHPLLIRSLNNLASMYDLTGHRDDADAAFGRAIAVAAKTLGTDHPTYGHLLLNYAGFLRSAGQKAKAKTLEARARTVLKDNQRSNGEGMTVDVSAFQSRR